MKFLFLPVFLYIILLLSASTLGAQATLSGEVTDNETGEPLIGASLLIQGTGIGTVTDYDGNFELKIRDPFPVVLEISYTGYRESVITITKEEQNLKIKLESDVIIIGAVEVKGQRISEKQKAAPLTIESMDVLAIKETPADNFYDGLGTLKGVDLTAASLAFKVINTRGFNSTSPVRSLQLIDGVDNQAPGLNFSLGNFLGSSELDVVKVDMIVGASSAFYGPNAFNGVISMETKNPFFHRGLSAQVKGGERNLLDAAIRYADVIRNKDSLPVLGFKLNLAYLQANDWEAENYDPVYETVTGVNNPGGFNAVNEYGDEYFPANDFSTADPWKFPGLNIHHRRGYREIDLVDYDTRNLKANAAFHFRLNPSQAEASPELILSSSFGNGTTVYQGDNRFRLENILFFQNRLELRKTDRYFVRLYATHEDAGDSYDPYFTALKLQEEVKANEVWSTNYANYWGNNFAGKAIGLGYPELETFYDPETMMFTATFDQEAADLWTQQFADTLFAWHAITQNFANQADPSNPTTQDFLEPGSAAFQEAFNRITSAKSNEIENGTLFYDKSALYHAQGEYTFTPSWADAWRVGASSRLYTPVSEGTIFSDTAGITITNWEVGAYTGLDKEFFDNKLRASVTVRVDKNQNFNLLATPAASLVWKPKPNNYVRASFSSGIRNPTLTDQYLNLNVGPAILTGNLTGFNDLVLLDCLMKYRETLNPDDLCFIDVAPVQPEKVKTFEVGYRTTLFNQLYLDASYYYSLYNDFLGFNIGAEVEIDQETGFLERLQVYRVAANSINQVTTQGASIGLNYYFANYFMLSGNYSWNRLNSELDDPIIPAFNTPEHKFNLGFSGRNVVLNLGALQLKNFGFSVNYKWIEGFLFEGSPQFTGLIPSYDLLDAQINYHIKSLDTTVKIGASNILNNQVFQTYGGPRIGRLAYISLLYEFKKF